jgi:hypothetical protein
MPKSEDFLQQKQLDMFFGGASPPLQNSLENKNLSKKTLENKEDTKNTAFNNNNFVSNLNNSSVLKLSSINPLSEDFIKKYNYKVNFDVNNALKFDTDKLPVNLLSTEALMQITAVLKFGAEKYSPNNWRNGFFWSRPLAAAMRHIMAFNNGEDKDVESGLSHLAHAACCIMFLLEFEKTHKNLDDRYKVNVQETSK